MSHAGGSTPGPPSIAPGQCPGGVVVHVYRRDGLCLVERPLPPGIRLDPSAASVPAVDADIAVMLAESQDLCVVAYDGDTGERMDLRGILGTDRI